MEPMLEVLRRAALLLGALLVSGACTIEAAPLSAPSAATSEIALSEGGERVYRLRASSYIDGRSGYARTQWEQARDVAVDRAGNLYVVGGTPSPDFPVTEGAYDTTLNYGGDGSGDFGDMDAFVMKLNPEGRIVWSSYLGGPNYDRAYAVEVDAKGYVYVAGRAGEGFPTTAGAVQPGFAGDTSRRGGYGYQDGFVAKLTPDGGELVWSTYFGGRGGGFIRDMDIDDRGRVYLAATMINSHIPHITPDAHQAELKGREDAVYAKLSADGRRVLYATYYGGTDNAGGDGGAPSIRVDGEGNAYMVAYTSADDIPITAKAFQPERAGGQDMMIAKFAASGKLLFSTYLGGGGEEELETHNLAIDSRGNVLVAAATTSIDFPVTATAFQSAFGGRDGSKSDAFIAKLSSDGTRLLAATYLGGAGRDAIEGIAVDENDDVAVTGATTSADFPTGGGAHQSRIAGKSDFFIAKLDANLTQVSYSTYLGGTSREEGRGIAISDAGDIIAVGHTQSDDFPIVNGFDDDLDGRWSAAYIRLSP